MAVDELISKLENITDNVEHLDLINDYSKILNDLEFIFFECKKAIDNLSDLDHQDYILDITYLKVYYFAEIVKKYLEITTKDKYDYEIDDIYFTGQTSGYYSKIDKVILSPLGICLNSVSDIDILKTIFHEFRHQRQQHFLNIDNFEDMLNYPSKFIRIIKNRIPKEILEETDEFDKVISSKYYNENYRRIYIEIDADLNALSLIRRMIIDVYDLSKNKTKNTRDKAKRIQEYLILGSVELEKLLIEENKLPPIYREETITMCPITSNVYYDGKKKDSLIFIDKCIKNEKDLSSFPILSLFMKDNRFKNYIEIIRDRNNYMLKYDSEKVKRIYDYYISTDPILIVSGYIFNNNTEKLKEFIQLHPSFKKEYKEEILDMISLLGVNNTIIDLLLDSKYRKKIKKGE